jgi:osmotically-inducible protein OsmY
MSTDLFWRTDSYLRDAVQYQLERELDVSPVDVDITAADGAIGLTGFVHSLAEKLAAEQAAQRVWGVIAVANDIQVTPESQRTDAEIARDAVEALRTQTYVPSGVRVTVSEGFVTLAGTVNRQFQRDAAEAAVKYLKGVTGLANCITVASR